MPDQDAMSGHGALPRRPYAELDPEPGGFETALAMGRRRRRRTAGTSVLASLSAVLLAVSLTGSAADTDARLEFAELPEAPVVTGPVDPGSAPAAVELDPPPTVADEGRSGTRGAGLAPARTAEAAREVRPAGASAPRSAARPTAPLRPRRPAPPAERSEQDLRACGTLSIDAPWCLYADRRMTSPKDEQTGDSTVSISVCLGRVSTTTRTLSFRGEQQVDFAITKEGSEEVLWQWSHQAVFGSEPTFDTVRPGDCRVYSVRWLEQSDNNGDYIHEKGRYVLTATALARELGTKNSARFTFDL
ncbi:MAG TPA: BsuPI-related putative proteinase inhibitor [Mycobacteriales bacterium]|nr:BsuPI-related putative proteinase inhibitor [Mycobacteriales bacterium]